MSPYFNTETGAMNPESDDLVTEAGAPEQDRQQQEDRARRDAIGAGKKPADPAKDAGTSPPALTREQMGDRWDTMRARLIAEPGLADDAAFMAEYTAMGSGAMGHGAEDGQRVVGTLYPDGRLLAPEDHPPVTIPRLSDEAREAFDLGPADADEVVEHQEELVGLADASGLPRYHVAALFQDVGAAFEDFTRDADIDTPEAGMAELVRTEGGRARQIATDAQALVRVLHESGNPNLIAAAEDLVALSNHPRVLIGAARLYQELKNLPPQGPWEQLLLGGGLKWAAQREEALRRAATPEPDDPAREVGRFGRP